MGFDAKDPVGPELAPSSTWQLIAHHPWRVEIPPDLGQNHDDVFRRSTGRPVRQNDLRAMLDGCVAGRKNGLPGAPLGDANLPEVAHTDRGKHLDAPEKERPEGRDIGFGPVGPFVGDPELLRQRSERVAAERERATGEHKRVEIEGELCRASGAEQLGFQERDVPLRSVGHDDRAASSAKGGAEASAFASRPWT